MGQNEPAYPQGYWEGVTRLEYFAVSAPKQIPEWFQHKQRAQPDNYDTYRNREVGTIMESKDFDACAEYEQQDRIDRMAQWPWFWASAVLAANKGGGK